MLLFGLLEDIGPLLGVIGTIFWIWMLIDCFNRAKAAPQRGCLLVLIFFTHWVGALVYFFIYVYPLSKLFSSTPQQQSVPQKPFVYYTPPTQTPHQEYQQGYQQRSVPYSAPPTYTPVSHTPVSHQQEEQSFDYEEPHASYPEMPPQQQ